MGAANSTLWPNDGDYRWGLQGRMWQHYEGTIWGRNLIALHYPAYQDAGRRGDKATQRQIVAEIIRLFQSEGRRAFQARHVPGTGTYTWVHITDTPSLNRLIRDRGGRRRHARRYGNIQPARYIQAADVPDLIDMPPLRPNMQGIQDLQVANIHHHAHAGAGNDALVMVAEGSHHDTVNLEPLPVALLREQMPHPAAVVAHHRAGQDAEQPLNIMGGILEAISDEDIASFLVQDINP